MDAVKNVLPSTVPAGSAPHPNPLPRVRGRGDQISALPVVVVQTIAGQRRQVADASAAALTQGVRPGMSLAEARVMCPGAECVEHDPAGDRRALEALGRWMSRFTPIVAAGWTVDPRERDAGEEVPAVLFLDLTGCERLFGGIATIVERVADALARFGVPAALAVAPTPGAAWALASVAEASGRVAVVGPEHLAAALSPLPLECLRLAGGAIAALRHLGLRTIGQLAALPREQLPARFGKSLLARLDQATGARPEPLVPLSYEVPIAAGLTFDAPVESLESIWLVLEKLLLDVLPELVRRGRGARRLELSFLPDRCSRRGPESKAINLSRPTRDRRTLLDLLRRSTDRLDCDGGFVAFRLDVSLHERVAEQQVALFGDEGGASQFELDRLIERLRVRLGEGAVVRPELVESYLPERAWRPMPEEAHAPPASPSTTALPPRPLHLLPTPAEVRVVCEPSDERTGRPRQFAWRGRVHRLAHAVGPERIAGEWWRGHNRTRDYYDVSDEAGQRFWIFRVIRAIDAQRLSVRWFLHGTYG